MITHGRTQPQGGTTAAHGNVDGGSKGKGGEGEHAEAEPSGHMLYRLYLLLNNRLESWGVDWLFQILGQLTFRALAAAGLSFFIVFFAGRPVISWLRRKKIGDTGQTDAAALQLTTASKANTPTMGGVMIAGSILTSVSLLADITNFYIILSLIVIVWLAVLGGFDDWLKLTAAARKAATGSTRQGLLAWEKLVFQLGLGFLVGYFIYSHGDNPQVAHDLAHALTLPFQKTYELMRDTGLVTNPALIYLPRLAFIIVAILMVAGMSNAVNITDGMDGLAVGGTAIVSFGLVVLTYVAGWQDAAQGLLVPYVPRSDELIVLGASTAGACLGFLWWNCSPAKVFMGDTGSLCLGGIIAYIAVVIRQEFVTLVMCGVFLLEIGSVVIQVGVFKITRMTSGTGRRVFRIAPLHHNLHLSGWTEQQVVTRFWILTCLFLALGLALIKLR